MVFEGLWEITAEILFRQFFHKMQCFLICSNTPRVKAWLDYKQGFFISRRMRNDAEEKEKRRELKMLNE
jgi:hypothetical protein